MTKKTTEQVEVSGPLESIPIINVSGKRMPSEYLEKATSMLSSHGALTIAGLGNAATVTMRLSFMLEKLGYKRSSVDIKEKMMAPQRWVPDPDDPEKKRGKWVDEPNRDLRPVAQLLIRLEKPIV